MPPPRKSGKVVALPVRSPQTTATTANLLSKAGEPAQTARLTSACPGRKIVTGFAFTRRHRLPHRRPLERAPASDPDARTRGSCAYIQAVQ